MGRGGEVFVLNMGTPIKVAELADPAPTVGAIRELIPTYTGDPLNQGKSSRIRK